MPVSRAPLRQYTSILDESDDEKRVVRSSKDKRFSEINEAIKAIRNAKKIKDISKVLEGKFVLPPRWVVPESPISPILVIPFLIFLLCFSTNYLAFLYQSNIPPGYNSLCTIYTKSQNVIAKNGTPKAFIRYFLRLFRSLPTLQLVPKDLTQIDHKLHLVTIIVHH